MKFDNKCDGICFQEPLKCEENRFKKKLYKLVNSYVANDIPDEFN